MTSEKIQLILSSVSQYLMPSYTGRYAHHGGTYVRATGGITLYGNVRYSYRLPVAYFLSEYSQLRFSLQMSGNARYVGLCLVTTGLENYDHKNGRVSCMHIFGNDYSWDDADPPLIPVVDLALGKFTSQSSTIDKNYSENAVNGIDGTVASTRVEDDPWWLVDLGKEYSISTILLHKNVDSKNETAESSKVFIRVYDGNQQIVYGSGSCELTNNVTKIELPPNTIAKRVIVNSYGEKKSLTLEGVEVIERYFPSQMLQKDIPIGFLYNGFTFEYIEFVQGSEKGAISSSHIADMKMVNIYPNSERGL